MSDIAIEEINGKKHLVFPDNMFKPFCLSYVGHPKLQNLKQQKKPLLVQAIMGPKHNQNSIIDITAGFGLDALVLAHYGAQVVMVERSPIISMLLEQALKEYQQCSPEVVRRITLIQADSDIYMTEAKESYDTIYMDPMHPERLKSALVKKEMRIMRRVVGGDLDQTSLFDTAISHAKKRVVVKRQLSSSQINERKPTRVYRGKRSRFDVYEISQT